MAYDNNNQPLVDYLKVSLREYTADNMSEKHIVDTIKQTAGEDLAPYEALLSEFQDVFSTFGVKNLTKLYHFLFIVLMYSQHFQFLLGQKMEDEPFIPVSPKTFKADAVAFTLKGKERKRVSYTKAVK
ncbi:hypothetical protein RhiirA1_480680 [Rhizophagus irregularis]|uniref:Uncharacterized protein n=1 Tax=Rhizophagus irregularis TaxID=588596 RepID=A0A2I1ECY3_9GLOM|nr:hypothetical protein RhiirA1_480680 [Rhizophagus irregularis]PKY19998.1 hypothetical protein RhiirB3_433188 [Rhizophagus irregularis]CAB5089348.1 unnamed protein product [Rhizophagus irregularis]CAB5376759.1 unnamed protein product [Rhizophagus irregularis]